MAKITIVVLPASEEIICKGTRQPLLDSSRVHLSRGFDPLTVICMTRSDASTIVSMWAWIGVAAAEQMGHADPSLRCRQTNCAGSPN
jgi:uncharacterized protein (DUF2147 family)